MHWAASLVAMAASAEATRAEASRVVHPEAAKKGEVATVTAGKAARAGHSEAAAVHSKSPAKKK